jgi:hypothetical protein
MFAQPNVIEPSHLAAAWKMLRHCLSGFLVLFWLATPAHSQAPNPPALVRFELNMNHPYVQVRVNGSEPLSFMLDTGAQVSVIDREVADRIQLAMTPMGGPPGATTGRPAVASDVTVELGSTTTRLDVVYAIPLNQLLSRHEGRDIHGRLGADFLSRFVVEMDYARGLIGLYDPDTFSYRGSGTVVPLILESRRPLVQATLFVQGAEPVRGTFLLNTAADGPVYLATAFVKSNHLLGANLPTRTGFVAGTGALDTQPVGRADTLLFGRVVIPQPLVYFSQHAGGGLAGQFGVDGIIGTEILRRFKVTWDYPQSRVYFKPNRYIDEPYTHAISDLSGFYLLASNVDLDRLWVEEVVEGGPADLAGIQPGDLIVAIDDTPVTDLTLDQIRRLFLVETTYRLTIERSGHDFSVELSLKETL